MTSKYSEEMEEIGLQISTLNHTIQQLQRNINHLMTEIREEGQQPVIIYSTEGITVCTHDWYRSDVKPLNLTFEICKKCGSIRHGEQIYIPSSSPETNT